MNRLIENIIEQWFCIMWNLSEFRWISMNLNESHRISVNAIESEETAFFTLNQYLLSRKWPSNDLGRVMHAGAALKDKNLIWELAWWDQAFTTCFELQFGLCCINYAAELTYATLFMQHKLAIGLELNRFEWFDF